MTTNVRVGTRTTAIQTARVGTPTANRSWFCTTASVRDTLDLLAPLLWVLSTCGGSQRLELRPRTLAHTLETEQKKNKQGLSGMREGYSNNVEIVRDEELFLEVA